MNRPRPQPSAEWHIRERVSCPVCRVFWPCALVRFLGGLWYVKCWICGEQQWMATRPE